LVWKVFGNHISKKWSAASCAETLFLLRTVPAFFGIVCVLFFFIPSYLTYEPRIHYEQVSVKLALVAIFSALGILMAVVRGVANWRATQKLTSNWLCKAETVTQPQLGFPAYQFSHNFPLVAVVGVRRPRLFIAKQIFNTLSPEELSAALEHERGHIAARDNLKRSIMRACRDVLLIVPYGRHLDEAWAEASEAAADEYAARRDRKTGLDLASALVKIARSIPVGAKATMPSAAFLVGGEEAVRGFKGRVKRLVQIANDSNSQISRPNFFSRVPTWIPLGIVLLLIGFTATQPHVLSVVHTVIEGAVSLLA
jgi:Zn-dependent protease with chaperone function